MKKKLLLLPKPGVMDEAHEKDSLGVVALNFCNADIPKGKQFGVPGCVFSPLNPATDISRFLRQAKQGV